MFYKMRRLRPGELKETDHKSVTRIKWQNWDLKPKLSDFEPLGLKC